MDENYEASRLFEVKDCTIIAIATGIRAQNLRELRDRLETIDKSSIYYHFWGGRLRSKFDDPEYINDFASWARHSLHDGILAERLGSINPIEFDSLEELRLELIDNIEQRLDESEFVPWAKADQQFAFITSQIVVFHTKKQVQKPEDFVKVMPKLSAGSIYYHFIDARRRTPERIDDLSKWLAGSNSKYTELIKDIARIDPYFASLTETQIQLTLIFNKHFGMINENIS
ncbi:hypothetical protein JW964_17220 [candidate division KSB1 bacterium]|nr:hypothetical protein [candidate division KSB1 bacterium]